MVGCHFNHIITPLSPSWDNTCQLSRFFLPCTKAQPLHKGACLPRQFSQPLQYCLLGKLRCTHKAMASWIRKQLFSELKVGLSTPLISNPKHIH
jgi:hypothetical protein